MNSHSVRLAVVITLLVAHSLLTLQSLIEFSFVELFTRAMADSAGRQVFADLCISILLIDVWMLEDARKHNRSAWPFVIMSVPLGSFATLLYLARREWDASRTPAAVRA